MSEYKNEKKPKTQLIDPLFVEGMALVQEIGDEKHKDHHWMKGVSVSEIIGAIERHVNAIKLGEAVDPETGEQHAYHAACGLMYVAYYHRNYGSYAQFFDLIYQRPPETGSELGGRPVPGQNDPGLSDQTAGRDSRAIRESIRGRVSGRDASSVGLVSSDEN